MTRSASAVDERPGDRLSIGALFKIYPVGKVKAILRAEGKQSVRERALPNHVVVYYVLMLAIFMTDSYREVMRRLLEGIRHARRNRDGVKVLGKSGMSQARARLGYEPFKRLYEEFVGPIAQRATKGAWYKRWLLVSFDGSTLDVADTPENDEEFGRDEGSSDAKCLSQATVGLFDRERHKSIVWSGLWCIRWRECGERNGSCMAGDRLAEKLRKGMLCLADRYYLGYEFWKAASATGADLLWRVKSRHILEPQQQLPDGSYLSKLYPSQYDRKMDRNGTVVRVFEYKFKWQRKSEVYRLITTILDPEAAPAEELAAIYHERWEIETSLSEVKTHLRGPGIVLRSKTPELVRQEFYAFLLSYFSVRGVMHEAALEADEDPDRLSFLHAVKVIRRKIPAFGIFPPAAMA